MGDCTFLLPQHVTGDSLEDVKKMLKESQNILKKGTEVRVDARRIDIIAVARTVQEIEQRLPQEWKSGVGDSLHPPSSP